MTAEVLQEHDIIWTKKPVLRAVYHDYYQRMLAFIKPGNTLEIGGGIGNLKQYLNNVTSTDIVSMPSLDATCDAQSLPFADESFDNIVAVDVLHHIERPIRFFSEAQRVLKPGGSIIFLDPAISKVSWFFYHFFHPEPVDFTTDPLIDAPLDPNRKPFDANQAVPELIFGKYQKKFQSLFPKLSILEKQYLSLWIYPLSGGFRPWCLIPQSCATFFLKVESYLEKFLGKYLGFRILIVLQKDTEQ